MKRREEENLSNTVKGAKTTNFGSIRTNTEEVETREGANGAFARSENEADMIGVETAVTTSVSVIVAKTRIENHVVAMRGLSKLRGHTFSLGLTGHRRQAEIESLTAHPEEAETARYSKIDSRALLGVVLYLGIAMVLLLGIGMFFPRAIVAALVRETEEFGVLPEITSVLEVVVPL
jgi:hypothetical protein